MAKTILGGGRQLTRAENGWQVPLQFSLPLLWGGEVYLWEKKWRCYGLCSLFYLNSLEKETQMYLVICSFIFCASPELSNFFKKWIFTKLFFYLIVHNYEENILGESSRDDSKTATGGWWAAVTFRKNLHPTPKELSCGWERSFQKHW